MKGGENIDPRKEKALAALLSSTTREEAAAKAGCSKRTLINYLKDPEFQQRYEKAHSDLVTAATQQIQRSLAPAISTLQSIAEDESAGLNARVSAAKGLLEYGIRLAELNDVYHRIEELESCVTKE